MRRATYYPIYREDHRTISIHALHEESDEDFNVTLTGQWSFQSTLSMRRATNTTIPHAPPQTEFQSTLSMRRATDNLAKDENADIISIHALHEESDARGFAGEIDLDISIHALHEESDHTGHATIPPILCYFNPRSP